MRAEPAQGAFEGTGTQKTYSQRAQLRPHLLTDLGGRVRLAVSHYHNEAQPTPTTDRTTPEALGIPGVNISPFTSGMVGIQINDGFSNPSIGYSASLPWIRAEANVDLVNTWTKIEAQSHLQVGHSI